MNINSLSNKNVLIIGASGQLGSELSNKLNNKTKQLTLLRQKHWVQNKSFFGYQATLLERDIYSLSQAEIKDLLFEQDIIFFLATVNKVSIPKTQRHSFLIKQLSTLNNVLQAACGTNKKIIFTSSCTLYGDSKESLISDSSREYPMNLYDLVKLSSDNLISYYKRVFDLNCVSVRLANIYGVDSHLSRIKNRRVINFFLEQMFLEKTINVIGDGKFYRNYISTSDAVDTLIYLSMAPSMIKDKLICASKENIYFIDAIKLLGNQFSKLTNKKVSIKLGRKEVFGGESRSFKLIPSGELDHLVSKFILLEDGFSALVSDYIKTLD